MAQVISIHSFRGGTGKSNITANVASLLALEGKRVGIVDADIQSPGIHILFGYAGRDFTQTLNNYLWGTAGMKDIVQDATARLGSSVPGALFLLPSSVRPGEIARILREKYEDRVLREAFKEFIQRCNLDVLMIDTHPGLNEETLLSLAISHSLGLVMRPDSQDYEGTSVTVEVAKKLNVRNLQLIVNKLPPLFDQAQVKERVEQTYQCPVAAVLPHSDELMMLSSAGVFSMRYPDHRLTALFREIAHKLAPGGTP